MRRFLSIWVAAVCLCAGAGAQQGVMHDIGDPTTKKVNCAGSRSYVDDSTGILYQSGSGSPCVWKDASLFMGALPVTGLVQLGDSTQIGVGASQPRYTVGSRLKNDLPGYWKNFGTSGFYTLDVAVVAWTQWAPTNSFDLPLVQYEAGINDANFIGVTTGGVNNAKLAVMAGARHIAIPLSSQVMASVATASGSWSANSAVGTTYNLPTAYGTSSAALSGTGMQSTTNNSTLTFSNLPASGKVGVTWLANDASAGTFTISVNGVLQTSLCSGTTTFSSAGCNSQTISRQGGFAPFAQEFAGNSGSTNAVVITVTSATNASNIVSILDVDTIPATTAAEPYVALNGVPKEQSDANSAASAAYDAVNSGVAAQLISDGLTRVFFADLRNGTPGVNTTTDYTACTNCAGGPGGLHPSDAGYENWAKTIKNAAAAAGLSLFNANTGATQSTSQAPIVTVFPFTTPDFSNDWLVNASGINSTSQRMPGISFYNNSYLNYRGSSNARIAYEYDTIHGTFALQLQPLVGPLCIGNQTSCPYEFYNGTLGAYFLEPMHFGSQGSPTGSATAVFPGTAYDNQVAVSANSTPLADVVWFSTAGGAITITLPNCKSQTGSSNWRATYIKDSSDANNVSFAPNNGGNADTLNGGTTAVTFTSPAQWRQFSVVCSTGNVGGTYEAVF
jgi:lysophospholipase L1-like esterase